ncbi:MAG: tetratricopeptide repeat protein [Hyphomonadaceae bacterium]|nr:tetratricopeptide repeat protein [Hyphomonadaceae bacterium]
MRGSLFRARGEWEKAIKAFERALDLNSDYAEARAELGRIKIELGLAQEAIADIDKAIALSPTDLASLSGWHFWAGQAALHAGDHKTALERLLQAQQANPADHNILPWLAVAYGGSGQEGKARALIAEYLDKMSGFTLSTWHQDNPRDHPIVGPQRDRIAATLKQLGIPEGRTKAASNPDLTSLPVAPQSIFHSAAPRRAPNACAFQNSERSGEIIDIEHDLSQGFRAKG